MSTTDKKGSKEKKEPFFERVGSFVTRNYKFILVFWAIILAAAIYPAIQLQGVLKYNEMDFLPKNLDYHQGDAIFDEQFPSNVSSFSTIIVIESDELISSDTNLQYISTLTERIYQDYNDSLADVQSILSIFNQYNDSYWQQMMEVEETIYKLLLDNITYANQEMHQAREELEALLLQIAAIYEFSWFNFSRTYFFGHYNTSLFTTGPTTEIYQSIATATNFSLGYVIPATYVDLVYLTVNTTLSSSQFMNDEIMHTIALSLTNTTLYQALGMPADYNQEIYPLLSAYHLNWSSSFSQLLTNSGISIVNGTNIGANTYNISSILDAYSSQGAVLSQLRTVNQTAFSGIDIKTIILSRALDLLDLTGTPIEEYVDPSMIPLFLEQTFDLGPNPNSTVLTTLASTFTEELMTVIFAATPPPETIDDIPGLLSQWVLSEDKKTALILVTYDVARLESIEAQDQAISEADMGIGQLAHELEEEMTLENTRIYHTGDKFVLYVWMQQAEKDAKLIDIFTIIFVIVILIVIFCSLVAPLIPLISIGSAIATSMAILWFISFGMNIHFMSTLFLVVTSLGAGIDYCIFIFSRYDEERKKGVSKEEAVKISITHAGESVFHSGLTVMVGFGALIIPNFPLLRILGLSMIVGISMSMLSAIIVVPSIMMVVGDLVWWPTFLQTALRPNKWFKRKREGNGEKLAADEKPLKEVPDGTPTYVKKEVLDQEKTREPFLVRFSHFVTKNGLVITILTLVIVAPFIYLTTTMNTSTDFMGMLPKDFEGTIGREALSGKMAFGDPTPLKLLFHEMPQDPMEIDSLQETNKLCFELSKLEHVKTIKTTTRPLGLPIAYTDPEALAFYGSQMDAFIGEDNRTLLIELYLDVNPYSSETEKFVRELPSNIEEILESYDLPLFTESDIYYLGLGQSLYEIKRVTDNSYPIVIPIVIVGVYLVLFFLFGSYFTPIRLIITIAMSIAFTLGMLQLVFAIGFGVPIFWLLPLMLFSILMGLGLDYDIFLVTRVKEYCQAGMTDKEAIAHALDHTAAIITSCGFIMSAAYSALMISQLWHLRELGFAFTLAIILDATVVRIIIVPAIMVLMERWNWTGPKWLQKVRRNPEKATITEATPTAGISTEGSKIKNEDPQLLQQNANKDRTGESYKDS